MDRLPTLDELRYFILLAKHSSFTKAAKIAKVSQPTLSLALRRLEKKLGNVTIIDRKSGRLVGMGRELLPCAKRAIAAVDEVRSRVQQSTSDVAEVRLGAGATACTFMLPPILRKFMARHRNAVRLVLREGTGEDLDLAVEDGDLDLAIVTKSDWSPSGPFDYWRTDELIVVAKPRINARAGWLCFTGKDSQRLLLAAEPSAFIAMELASMGAVKSHLLEGAGRALISRSAVEKELKKKSVVELTEKFSFAPVTRQLILRHSGDKKLSPMARKLRKHLLASVKPEHRR